MTKQWSLLSLLLWTVASVAASKDVQKPILQDAGKPAPADLAVPSPSPSPSPSSSSPPHEPRKLKGRFLHITDIHLDPNYRPGTKPSKACHRLSTSSNSGNKGGLLGNPGTKCDSPPSLLDATFDWIRDHLLDDIDFIVWTGDAARHDNDARVPRSFDEVLELNEVVVRHIREFFTHDNTDAGDGNGEGRKHMRVPFVPNIGNNDFMPHNMFPGAPNQWTVAFGRLWSDFIPAAQQPAFVDGGGWFSVEVIPGKLAVISLNTMYFFDLNEAVDGCYGPGEPGYEHFEWLRGELQGMRERGVKAVLIWVGTMPSGTYHYFPNQIL
ncbi:Endopolyphosphatase [Ascosphaera atra]|nr:Endopolyphosphatase [Ascosphaera atra]